MTRAPVVRHHDVVAAQRGADPGRDRLLADGRVDTARDVAGPDELDRVLLEAADQPDGPVQIFWPRTRWLSHHRLLLSWKRGATCAPGRYRMLRANSRTDQVIAAAASPTRMTRLSHTEKAVMSPANRARIPFVAQ